MGVPLVDGKIGSPVLVEVHISWPGPPGYLSYQKNIFRIELTSVMVVIQVKESPF